MIRNSREREKAVELLQTAQQNRDEVAARLQAAGVGPDIITAAVGALDDILYQHEAEIAAYDRSLGVPLNSSTWRLADLPGAFIVLRMRESESQEAFGARMGLRGNKICRYERTGYNGLSVTRLVTMLAAVGFEAQVTLVPRGSTMVLPFDETEADDALMLDEDPPDDFAPDESAPAAPVTVVSSAPTPQSSAVQSALPAVTF